LGRLLTIVLLVTLGTYTAGYFLGLLIISMDVSILGMNTPYLSSGFDGIISPFTSSLGNTNIDSDDDGDALLVIIVVIAAIISFILGLATSYLIVSLGMLFATYFGVALIVTLFVIYSKEFGFKKVTIATSFLLPILAPIAFVGGVREPIPHYLTGEMLSITASILAAGIGLVFLSYLAKRFKISLGVTMLGTLLLVGGFFGVIMSILAQYIESAWITMMLILVAIYVIQWLLAPYLIDRIFSVKQASYFKYPELHRAIQRLEVSTGVNVDKVMIADIDAPNAFAYGSPIAGKRVAVTRGLLELLDKDEVEAVLGHEVGHLKHRDVQIMVFLSVLPAMVYLFARYFLYGRKLKYIGIGFGLLSAYFVLNLMILGFSRLREYYADRFSAANVPSGNQSLATGLAKLVKHSSMTKGGKKSALAFRALMISGPQKTELGTAYEIVNREVTLSDNIAEIFSTHPNMTKRLRALIG